MNDIAIKIKSISFRSQLQGDIFDFCNEENISCAKTIEAIVQLVSSLASYREERLSLAPEVFICNDASRMCSMIQGSQMLEIGSGELSAATAKLALKKCAPLAIGGWAIFIERGVRGMRYGLFTATNLPLALNPAEILLDGSDPSFPIIAAYQLAENVVELRGISGQCLQINFSSVKIEEPSPRTAVNELVKAITKDISAEFLIPASRFINRSLEQFLACSHGTLAAVIPKHKRLPPRSMRDGVLFDSPFSIVDKVKKYGLNRTDEAMAILLSASSLLQGIMMSDGITLFRSDGSIIGYNIFLKGKHNVKEPENVLGGARRRTFQRLSEMVPKSLIAAFIQSHDGYMECR